MAGAVLVLGVLAFAAVAVKGSWDAVRDDLGLIGGWDYAAASASAVAGLLALWITWHLVVIGLGAHLSRSDSLTIYFAAQLGKYVPGSVWPAMIQARLGKRNGIAATTMLVSYAIWMGVLCAIGAIASVGVLTNSSIGVPWPVIVGALLLAIAVLPVFLHDRGLPRLVGWAMARIGRAIDPIHLDAGAAWRTTGASAVTWLLFGVHAWFLARPLGADGSDLPLVIGSFALAFVAGVVAIPVPAGAGIREAVLVLTLGAEIGRPSAIAVALLSRLIMILAEMVLAAFTGVPGAIRWARTDGAAAT